MRVCKPLLLLLLACHAQPSLADDRRQHAAHEHGAGKLDIAQDGSALLVSLDTPAVNIVGFEHAPKTAEESEALQTALARLEDGAELFALPTSADCRLTAAEVKTPLVDDADHEHHHEHDHAHHEAHEHHEHEKTHADITATWRFTCAHPHAVNRIEVKLFAAFPMTQRLQVQFITTNRQGGVELNPPNTVLNF